MPPLIDAVTVDRRAVPAPRWHCEPCGDSDGIETRRLERNANELEQPADRVGIVDQDLVQDMVNQTRRTSLK